MQVFILDFEATDKDAAKARPLELYVAILDPDTKRVVNSFHALMLGPDYPPISQEILDLTGITLQELADNSVTPKRAFENFLSLVQKDDVLVAHNAHDYDKVLFETECRRQAITPPAVIWVDTRYDIPYTMRNQCRILSHLALEHGVPVDMSKLHRAKADVDLLVQIIALYDFNVVYALATEKKLIIQADVSFEKKDLAKDLKYRWQEPCKGLFFAKKWVKQIRESELNNERMAASFPVKVLC